MRDGFLIAAAWMIVGAAMPAPADGPEPKPAAGPMDTAGTLRGSPYRIDIPADWNGELVMLLHGYEPKGVPRETPWPGNEAAPVFLQRGYAVAAPAYSAQGWAVAEALPDIERLRRHFAATYGEPTRTWLAGFSMGGHLALASLERHGRAYDGALSLCGVNMPAETVFGEAILTPLVAFGYFFPDAMPLASGGLADPNSPPMLDPAAIEAALKTDEATASLLAARLQIPRSGLAGALMLNYLVLREMQQRAGGFPIDNSEAVYAGFGDDAAFNKGVRRYTGSPAAIAYAHANADLTGRIDDPVVLLSNNADPTVPARYDAVYPKLVRAAGQADELIVLPAVGEGHCDFTGEQIGAAFETLVNNAGH